MHPLHGKVIHFKQLSKIPQRQYYDKTPPDANTLEFMPTAYREITHEEKRFVYKYALCIFGVLRNGTKTIVMISDIKPWIGIQVPADIDPYTFIETIQTSLGATVQCEIITRNQFRGYNPNSCTYIKASFTKLKDRYACVIWAKNTNQITIHDDSCASMGYYRVWERDNQTTLSAWVTLHDYKRTTSSAIRGEVLSVSTVNYRKLENVPVSMLKDPSIALSWDIETYSSSGELPKPDNPDDSMFMISMLFYRWHSTIALLKVCLVNADCDPHPDYVTVVCDCESQLIKGFAYIFQRIMPEFVYGFNDSGYDWPWLIGRAIKYGLMKYLAEHMDLFIPFGGHSEDAVQKYSVRKEKVKLEAGRDKEGVSLQLTGYIPVDVMTVFQRIYKTEPRCSLNFYLSDNNISNKEDMSIYRLFRSFEDSQLVRQKKYRREGEVVAVESEDVPAEFDAFAAEAKQTMRLVAYYCIMDSHRTHELMCIRNVIADSRAIADASYCSVYDAFYRADGMKVRNLTMAIGQLAPFNLGFSSHQDDEIEEGKYPGGFVASPITGMQASKLNFWERRTRGDRPWKDMSDAEIQKYHYVVREIGKAYLTESEYDELKKNKVLIKNHPVFMEPHFREFITEVMQRPATALDFSSLYPSLMRAYNLSPDKIITEENEEMANRLREQGVKLVDIQFMFGTRRVRGWAVHHNNHIEISDPEFNFGIYPYILNQLFQQRDTVKQEMKKLGKQREALDHEWRHAGGDAEHKADETSRHNEEMSDLRFRINCLDSKQRAIKVFMNTFYGEAGNKLSPFFLVQVAGGTTQYGQASWRLVNDTLIGLGCRVLYGDTDSVYITMPNAVFDVIDELYYGGRQTKLWYWTEMVKITHVESMKIQRIINDKLIAETGGKFMKMAFEEILFPVLFAAKKKYVGIATEDPQHINFTPDELFIRGFDLKKRGATKLLIDSNIRVLRTAFAVDNVYTIRELVFREIDAIYNRRWTLADTPEFIKSDAYKPGKQNVKVHRFVELMARRGITIPPNDRFEYVVVKRPPFTYDENGRKVGLGLGDRMEFPQNVSLDEPIDVDYYMQSSINGQFARMIVYDREFIVDAATDDKEDQKIADRKTYEAACKYIDNYCRRYYVEYPNKGVLYRRVYSIARKYVQEAIPAGVKTFSNVALRGMNEELTLINQAVYDLQDVIAARAREFVNVLIKKMSYTRVLGVYYGQLSNGKYNGKTRNTRNGICDTYIRRYKQQTEFLVTHMRKLVETLEPVSKIQRELEQRIVDILKKNKDLDSLYLDPGDKIVPYDAIPDKLDVDAEITACRRDITVTEEQLKALHSFMKMRRSYSGLVCEIAYYEAIRTYLRELANARNGSLCVAYDTTHDVDSILAGMF